MKVPSDEAVLGQLGLRQPRLAEGQAGLRQAALGQRALAGVLAAALAQLRVVLASPRARRGDPAARARGGRRLLACSCSCNVNNLESEKDSTRSHPNSERLAVL